MRVDPLHPIAMKGEGAASNKRIGATDEVDSRIGSREKVMAEAVGLQPAHPQGGNMVDGH